MPTWDSSQYRRFERERTQPAVDLASRIDLAEPARVIDLGCGPGNSTAVLAQRWPLAKLTGLDSSEDMLAAAQLRHPKIDWQIGDIASWKPAVPYDIIFSNAALQWVPNHQTLLPRLLSLVRVGGVLAFQVPADPHAVPHQLIRDLAKTDSWKAKFQPLPREWRVEPAAFYYDVLAPQSQRLELWTTEYLHIFPNAAAIVDWYRGTGLRPWLDTLADDAERTRFLTDYLAAITAAYPVRQDGCVLFPFKRLFVVAYR